MGQRRRLGELRRSRSASRGFKFTEEGARADRYHLFELLIEAFWRQFKHGWLFLNTLDGTVAVRRLVAFYVREHNEKIPRAVLGARTPDEVYFGREENATR